MHVNEINLDGNAVLFKSSFLNFKAAIKADKKDSYINFSYIKIPQNGITVKNTVVNIRFLKKSIDINGFGTYDKYRFKIISALTGNGVFNIRLSFPHVIYDKDSFKTDITNLRVDVQNNLQTGSKIISGNFKEAKINYKQAYFVLKKSAFIIKKDFLKLNSKYFYMPEFNILKEIKAADIHLFYNWRKNFLKLDTPVLSAQYKKYTLKLKNSELIFKNLKNFNIKSKQITVKFENNTLVLKKDILNVLNGGVFYSFGEGRFENRYAALNSSKIIGDLISVFTKEIKGKVFSYQTDLQNIKANIKKRSLNIQNANINSVKINRISFKDNLLTFHSKALFNQNIKEILHRFLKINIPVTQIAGENNITSSIYFVKNISSFTHVHTKVSLLKLFDFNLFVPQGDINITNTDLKFNTKNAQLYLQKKLPLKFTGKGLIDFKKEKLIMNGKINFEISKIIKLKNYQETAVIDFKKQTLETKNSSVYINFDKKLLIINRIKKLLDYTPFYNFVKNGLLLITFSKNTDITSYLLLKLPVLYKHTNKPVRDLNKNIINKIFLNVTIKPKQIDIFNNNLDINVKNSNINVKMKNLDINLYPLETLLLDTNSSSEFNYSVKLETTNANLMYKQHKFLSKKATLVYKNDNVKFNSTYKHSSIKGYTKQGYLLLEGKNFSNEEFRAFLPKFDFFSKINLDFVMVKSPDNFYTGKIYINSAIVRDLKSLNNIIAFINTIPSLLSFSSPGFSSKGYKIKKGYINYLLYKKILYIKDAKIYGDNLDFFAKGYINFNKNYMFLKITANMKMKLKKIPIIGKGLSYLLFGKDGSINIKMVVKGDINNPKVKEDIGKDILITPFTLFKRAITLPFNLF